MKRIVQFIGASLVTLSVATLSGCFGNGGSGGISLVQPQPQPQPQPEATLFTEFVHDQFAADVRDSEMAQPVDINDINFTFDDTPSPHAYDDLFADTSSSGSGS